MTKKSLIAAILAGMMMLTVSGCGNSSSSSASTGSTSSTDSAATDSSAPADTSSTGASDSAETKVGQNVLKLSFNQSIDNPEAQTILEMSDNLYDATDGRYSIEVYPNEQLGGQQQSLELVQAGAVDMALVANSIIENVKPDFAILGTPYVYNSVEHQQKLFESDALDDLFDTTKDSGFTVLAAYGLGPRCVYSTKPVTSPEDLKGMKIRVMQSDTMVQMMNCMGGVGTPMGQGDVYSAIQAGTLDGAENNIITYVDLLQYEVAPYFSETNHLMIPDEVIISNSMMDSMSAEDQEALKTVAKQSVTTAFEKCAALRAEYTEKAQNELGVTITPVDITPFQQNCADFIQEVANRSDMTKAVYATIQEMA